MSGTFAVVANFLFLYLHIVKVSRKSREIWTLSYCAPKEFSKCDNFNIVMNINMVLIVKIILLLKDRTSSTRRFFILLTCDPRTLGQEKNPKSDKIVVWFLYLINIANKWIIIFSVVDTCSTCNMFEKSVQNDICIAFLYEPFSTFHHLHMGVSIVLAAY